MFVRLLQAMQHSCPSLILSLRRLYPSSLGTAAYDLASIQSLCATQLTYIYPSATVADRIVSHVSHTLICTPSHKLVLTPYPGIKRQTECKYAHVANLLEYDP